MPDSFIFDKFELTSDQQTVLFRYRIIHADDSYNIVESLKFPVRIDHIRQGPTLKALHIALGISYYKIFLAPTIKTPYQLDQLEVDFWNNVYLNGLGEFLYTNKINPARLAKFKAQTGKTYSLTNLDNPKGAVLGIGGGKDSIVAGEILKKTGLSMSGFVLATGQQTGQASAVAQTMQTPLLVVERTIDKQLIDLQDLSGAYHGHVPISLIFALIGSVLAIATNQQYVVVANEASASLPRAKWEYGEVNHQWSKSLEFEQAFQAFVHESISKDITYFSAIRELTSVAVAKIFANYPEYFEVFTSDNSVFRVDASKRPIGRWSQDSPKSLSSFILLAPWISEETAIKTFGHDFLDDTSLEDLFLHLVGTKGEQPLDCVGTTDELKLSLHLLTSQNKFQDSHLVKLFAKIPQSSDLTNELQTMLELQNGHAIPAELLSDINRKILKELQQ